MEGEWAVAFQRKRGAPPAVTLPFLGSLSGHRDPGVRYFSGTASYARTLNAPAEWFAPNREIRLMCRVISSLNKPGAGSRQRDDDNSPCAGNAGKVARSIRPLSEGMMIHATRYAMNPTPVPSAIASHTTRTRVTSASK